MDAYILIGNPNTRKASLARCLTGCFNRSVRDIQPRGAASAVRLYARAGALQDTRTTAEAFMAEAARARSAAVLCCLLPDAHAVEPALYPGARHYLAHFEAAGWRVRAIAVLGQNGGGLRAAQLRQFPQAPTAPLNLTAQALRLHFDWV
jgi:hypothetical protein